MNITPVIPDGYNGTVKQLTCRICKHIFYLTMADYDRLQEVHYCHECSLVLREELERNQMASDSIPTTQTPFRLLSHSSKHRTTFSDHQNRLTPIAGHLYLSHSRAPSTVTK